MARTLQDSPSTLMRRTLESQIAELRQQISVFQNEISLREKVLHDLDALEKRSTAAAPNKIRPLVIKKLGLTDAIREIINGASTELSAPEIRDQLLSSGFASRSNFLVAIHSTLSRLDKAGEIRKSTTTGKWVALHALHNANQKQGLALVSQTGSSQLTPISTIPTQPSPLQRADKVELIVTLRREGKTNKEIAKALGMDTHAFQCYVTTLIRRGLLQRRDPGRRARSVLQAAGENP